MPVDSVSSTTIASAGSAAAMVRRTASGFKGRASASASARATRAARLAARSAATASARAVAGAMRARTAAVSSATVARASPTMATVAGKFLPISHGSSSRWISGLAGASASTPAAWLWVRRSAPRLMTRSWASVSARTAGVIRATEPA